MKNTIQDFKRFSLLEIIVIIIDLILNPKATTYPIITGEIPTKEKEPFTYIRFKKETGHLLTIKRKNSYILYIRWL